MLEILKFIFSGFFTFIGVLILMSVVGRLIVALIIGLVAILCTKSNVNIK